MYLLTLLTTFGILLACHDTSNVNSYISSSKNVKTKDLSAGFVSNKWPMLTFRVQNKYKYDLK